MPLLLHLNGEVISDSSIRVLEQHNLSWIDAVRYAQWLARESAKTYGMVGDPEYEKVAAGP